MSTRPIRVLHLIGAMAGGGAETWLLNVIRKTDPSRFQMDLVVHDQLTHQYDDEARALGCRLLVCEEPTRPWIWARNFRNLMEQVGPVDVVHGHQHHFSAIGLREAARAGVALRVAHSHVDTTAVDAKARVWRKQYLWMMRRWSSRYSNLKLAATSAAATSLFGNAVGKSSKVHLMPYGIDMSGRPVEPSGRETFGFDTRDRIVIVVGRLAQQKNTRFAIEVLARLSALLPEARLLVLGTGPLLAALKDRVTSLSLGDSVVFAGWRSDLPQILAGAADLFLMPSVYEGMPLALIEAQAAGLPCLVSDAIASHVNAIPSLVHRLPLSAGVDAWAAKCHALLKDTSRLSAEDALSFLRDSEFNSGNSARRLFELYSEHLRSIRAVDPKVQVS